jgi:hypothetical protein
MPCTCQDSLSAVQSRSHHQSPTHPPTYTLTPVTHPQVTGPPSIPGNTAASSIHMPVSPPPPPPPLLLLLLLQAGQVPWTPPVIDAPDADIWGSLHLLLVSLLPGAGQAASSFSCCCCCCCAAGAWTPFITRPVTVLLKKCCGARQPKGQPCRTRGVPTDPAAAGWPCKDTLRAYPAFCCCDGCNSCC